LVVVLGLPADNPQLVQQLADSGDWMIYFQSDQADQVRQVRESAESAGLLGRRVFADVGPFNAIPLTPNLADAIWVDPAVGPQVVADELLRVLRPEATAIVGDRRLVKPMPTGLDDWSHP